MNLEASMDSASRFVAFVEELTSVIGHADRARPMRDYCAGLLVSEGRRSVEPIAAVTAPAEVSVQHQKRSEEHTSELQSLRHLVCRLLLEKKKKKRKK